MRWSAPGATGARENASSPGVGTDEEDRGSISLLSLGMMLVAAMLIVVGVDITAVQLARTQLWDAADSAALDAADCIDEDRVYTQGLPSMVPVTSAGVAEVAGEHLSAERRPHLVRSWSLGGRTGSPDGETAVVEVTGHVDLPIVGSVVEAFGGGVDVTVVSRARSAVR